MFPGQAPGPQLLFVLTTNCSPAKNFLCTAMRSDDDCLKQIIPENSEILFETVDVEHFLNAINQLEKKEKHPVPIKVRIMSVKDAVISLAYPLVLIYNASVTNGIFPGILILARVTPIYKSAPETDRLTQDQLFKFLKTTKQSTSNQTICGKQFERYRCHK